MIFNFFLFDRYAKVFSLLDSIEKKIEDSVVQSLIIVARQRLNVSQILDAGKELEEKK